MLHEVLPCWIGKYDKCKFWPFVLFGEQIWCHIWTQNRSFTQVECFVDMKIIIFTSDGYVAQIEPSRQNWKKSILSIYIDCRAELILFPDSETRIHAEKINMQVFILHLIFSQINIFLITTQGGTLFWLIFINRTEEMCQEKNNSTSVVTKQRFWSLIEVKWISYIFCWQINHFLKVAGVHYL